MSDIEEPRTPQMAVQALDSDWGDCFDIAFSGGQFHAKRIDGTGPALAAAAAEDLHEAISADYESARDQLDRAVAAAYHARGITITHSGLWHAVIREPDGGQTVITRNDRAALMGRLRELDIAGVLSDQP